MNEIYVASSNAGISSDGVFYTRHVDGPFSVFPLCSVYRCVVAVNFNREIETRFPQLPLNLTLSSGDAVAFDYNREVPAFFGQFSPHFPGFAHDFRANLAKIRRSTSSATPAAATTASASA